MHCKLFLELMPLCEMQVKDCLAAAEGGKEYSWPARKLASSAEDSKLTQHEEDVQQLVSLQGEALEGAVSACCGVSGGRGSGGDFSSCLL